MPMLERTSGEREQDTGVVFIQTIYGPVNRPPRPIANRSYGPFYAPLAFQVSEKISLVGNPANHRLCSQNWFCL
jgi:hypothetical protein